MPEPTMAQRISRAYRTVSDVRWNGPGDLRAVPKVMYLVFNEGYTADVDLAAEAIRLARQFAGATGDSGGGWAVGPVHLAARAARTRGEGSNTSGKSLQCLAASPTTGPNAFE